MIDKAAVITELQRVAQILDTKHLGSRDFEKLSKISRNVVLNRFGSWNKALQAAGLFPAKSSKKSTPSDDELLIQIITLTERLQKIPSESDLAAHGDYSRQPYKTRWGSLNLAREAAYKKYGMPIVGEPIQAKTPRTHQKQGE